MQTKRSQSKSRNTHTPPRSPAAIDSPSDESLALETKPRCRVVIVDDEPDIHLTIQYILEQSDEFVLAGSYLNGIEALQGILAHPPDLVLMDIRLPDLSGIECTRRLSLALPQLKIVMISALNDRQTVEEALEAGCHNYVTKPFVATQFLTSLRCALAPTTSDGRVLSDSMASCPLRRNAGAAVCVSVREREAKVLNALAKGRYYKEIADEFNLSQSMAHKLVHLAFRKLGVNSRHQAVTQWRVCSHCPHLLIRMTSKSGRRRSIRGNAP